jgi:hypothetical protein
MKKLRYLIFGLLVLSTVANAQTDSTKLVVNKQGVPEQTIVKDERRMQHQIKDVITKRRVLSIRP